MVWLIQLWSYTCSSKNGQMPSPELNPVFQGKHFRDSFLNCSYKETKKTHNNRIYYILPAQILCLLPRFGVPRQEKEMLGPYWRACPPSSKWSLVWGSEPSLVVGSTAIFHHHLELPKLCQGSGRCCLAEHMPKSGWRVPPPPRILILKAVKERGREGRSWGSGGEGRGCSAHLPVNDALAL